MITPELVKISIHLVSTDIFHLLIIPVAIFSAFFYFFGVMGILQRKRTLSSKLTHFPKVTIQIPTFNEIVAIRCAEKCMQFDYPGKFEILIGDDSNDAEVSKIIDGFAKKHKVRVIRRGTNEGFKAGNLNNMLRHSRGEIIVIFDSDFIPSKDFLKKIVQPFADKRVACVQSKWSYLNMEQSPTAKFASTVLMVYHNILAKLNNQAGVSLLFGSGQAVRKSVLQKLGGWQMGSVTEDVEFSVRALVGGYKTVYLDSLSVAGEVPFNSRSLRIQQKRWAYGNTKTFLEHRKSILLGKFSPVQKALMTFTMLGYISSFFLVAFMFFGAVSFMTGEPSQINVSQLALDVGINFVLASGFTFAGIVALWKDGKTKHVFVVFFTALTIGILVSISVCNGITKALRGKQMYWNIIRKKGNLEFLPDAYGIKVGALKG